MRRNLFVAMVASGLLAACASAPQAQSAPEPQRYSGLLRYWFEGQSFHADGEAAPWAFGMTPEAMLEIGGAYPDGYAPGAESTALVVEVEGVLSPANPDAARYGPIGNYQHYLLISRVRAARLLRARCELATASVYFETGAAEISPTSVQIIDHAVGQARRRACNVSRVRVVGHTDTVGSARANQALSERRAAAVREALIARGIGAELLAVEAAGESRPFRHTRDNVAEPINRYVEIIFEAPAGEQR